MQTCRHSLLHPTMQHSARLGNGVCTHTRTHPLTGRRAHLRHAEAGGGYALQHVEDPHCVVAHLGYFGRALPERRPPPRAAGQSYWPYICLLFAFIFAVITHMSRLPMLRCMWVSVPGIGTMRRATYIQQARVHARTDRERARARARARHRHPAASHFTLTCVCTRTLCVSVRVSLCACT